MFMITFALAKRPELSRRLQGDTNLEKPILDIPIYWPGKDNKLFDTREDAEAGCRDRGCEGLCTKSQVTWDGQMNFCTPGWVKKDRNCGTCVGTSDWDRTCPDPLQEGLVWTQYTEDTAGAFCCGCEAEYKMAFIGFDKKTKGYAFRTDRQAKERCKSLGFKGLCSKKETTGFSVCHPGYHSNFRGLYHAAGGDMYQECDIVDEERMRAQRSGHTVPGLKSGWGHMRVGKSSKFPKAGAFCCHEGEDTCVRVAITDMKQFASNRKLIKTITDEDDRDRCDAVGEPIELTLTLESERATELESSMEFAKMSETFTEHKLSAAISVTAEAGFDMGVASGSISTTAEVGNENTWSATASSEARRAENKKSVKVFKESETIVRKIYAEHHTKYSRTSEKWRFTTNWSATATCYSEDGKALETRKITGKFRNTFLTQHKSVEDAAVPCWGNKEDQDNCRCAPNKKCSNYQHHVEWCYVHKKSCSDAVKGDFGWWSEVACKLEALEANKKK